MEVKIAVLVDKNSSPISIKELGTIKIYTRIGELWDDTQEIQYALDMKKNIAEIRSDFQKIIETLGECRIFVASEVSGVVYNCLEKADFKIWEISDKPYEFLDYVAEKSFEKVPEVFQEEMQVIITEDGECNIDIRKFQQSNVGLTSKQALKPLLNNEKIKMLQVICDHIPHWILGEAKKLNRSYEIVEEGNGIYKIVIKRI